MCLTYRVVYLLATLQEEKTAPSSPFTISMDVTLTGFQNAEHLVRLHIFSAYKSRRMT